MDDINITNAVNLLTAIIQLVAAILVLKAANRK